MQYLTSFYSERFAHPILAGVLTVAVVFFLFGLALELTAPFTIPLTGRQVPKFTAGFFGVFGTLALAIGSLGYGVLFASKAVSIVRDQMSPTSA
jgi:hypothetical protein